VRSAFLLVLLSRAALAGPASSAVEQSNVKVRTALDHFFKAKGPAREKARAEARAAVGRLIDFETLARSTLGAHWESLKPAQRSHYSAALKGAMEASYLSRMKPGEGVDVAAVKTELLGEAPQGDDVLVKTKVISGKDSASIDYLMHKEAKGYRAIDVLTEGTSLVDTYRESVGKQLPKKGIDGVIATLEKKRKQFEEAGPDAPAPSPTDAPAKADAPAPGAAATPAPAAPASPSR